MTESLSPAEIARYARQVVLPEVGVDGQRRLKGASVIVIGAGGLGAPACAYLAAAGVGTLGIVDCDAVDLSNLQRQLLYGSEDIGRRKVEAAAQRLRSINPHIDVLPFDAELTRDNALRILRGFDFVVDGTDNFRTRYLVNDACVLLGIPNVYASVLRFDGQVTILGAPNGPCYRCLYPAPPPPGSVPSCAEAGVLGVLPGLLGMLQATETVKLILGCGEPLVGRLLLVDSLAGQFTKIALRKDPACIACGTRELRELADYEAFCAGPAAVAVPTQVQQVTPVELETWRANGRNLVLLDVRERWEWDVGHIAGATLVPMGQLEVAVPGLDPSADTVVYCHHGVRAQAAAEWLLSLGFRRVFNIAGGIDAWSTDVDPNMPRY